MKRFMKKLMQDPTSRHILTAASYVFLTALFFGAGYLIGFENGDGMLSTPVSVSSSADETDTTPSPAPTEMSASYRVVLEDGELRMYLDENGGSRLVSNEQVSEALFPKSDIETLKKGLFFNTLEEALSMMENFLS